MNKEVKNALEVIKNYEKEEDVLYRKEEIKHLKKFEGKYYNPQWVNKNTYEKVIKVDDIGDFFSEIITINIDIKKIHTNFSRVSTQPGYFRTFVGGTTAPPNQNRISEKHYVNIKKLINKFNNNLDELRKSTSQNNRSVS